MIVTICETVVNEQQSHSALCDMYRKADTYFSDQRFASINIVTNIHLMTLKQIQMNQTIVIAQQYRQINTSIHESIALHDKHSFVGKYSS